jgi:hypothetical protein
MSGLSCEEVEALAPELALGVLTGDERATALLHLSSCPACRERVEQLASVADQLLLAAPDYEPPIRFESRVLDRVAQARTPPLAPVTNRWRRSRVAVLVVAAAVAAAVGGLAVTRAGSGTDPAAVRTALVSFGGGRWSCRVAAFPGQGQRPTEVVVRLDEPNQESSSYTVQAEPVSGGAPVAIGTITLVGGRGVLDASVPAAAGKIRAIRVIEANGTARYPDATFAPA